ncbi:hypothetical protein [Burkholderia sp. GbtcB21]|uniref:hypothetical protein n=1 Tax=Burkholderia sp. GbtcB21 TaxID=2824766 RepID=UPI001C3027FE|nr:hypothetical protein [Burkholderia sp. GbtcB21]
MNQLRNEAGRTSVEFMDGVSGGLRVAIYHTLSSIGAVEQVVVADGHAGFDEQRARDALSAGHSFVILDAKAGQLSTVFRGTGITVPQDVALFAVQRREIPGHKDRYHTAVTIVPHEDSIMFRESGSRPLLPVEQVAHAIAQHVAEPAQLDTNLIPPTGAYFHILTYTFQKGPAPISTSNTGSGPFSQPYSIRNTHNYYIYYANGDGQDPYYLIFLDLNSNCVPGVGGIYNRDWGRGAGLTTNTVSSTVLDGSLSLVDLSPDGTTGSPVTTAVDYQITVMADDGGGSTSTPFTISKSVQTSNDNWGVGQTGVQSNNEAAWTYYENGLWSALSQTPDNFDSWKWNLYAPDGSSGDIQYYKVRPLDAQFNNGVSGETMALWTIPQNSGNQSPLNCQLHFKHEFLVELINSTNWTTPTLYSWTVSNEWDVPAWDLVALTGSPQS